MVTCETPAHEEGPIFLEIFCDGLSTESMARFQFIGAPEVDFVKPSMISASRSTTVTVYGSKFFNTEQLSCRLQGINIVNAVWLSSSKVSCTFQVDSQGNVSVEVSNDLLYFGLGSLSVQHPFLEDLIVSLHPTQGPTMGNTLVSIVLAKSTVFQKIDPSETFCFFGHERRLLFAVRESWGCYSPSTLQPSIVSFQIGFKPRDLPDSLHSFEYYDNPQVLSLYPSRGTVRGGTMIDVLGTGFEPASIFCKFGQSTNNHIERFISSTMLKCMSSLSMSLGTVSVEISNNAGVDFTDQGRQFLFELAPIVVSVSPSFADVNAGPRLVTIFGQNFENTRELCCKFGIKVRHPALYMSSTMITCFAPQGKPGTVSLAVSNNGNDGSASSIRFEYRTMTLLQSILPSMGPSTGGTAITIFSSHTTPQFASLLRCRFGIEEVQVSTLSAHLLVCRSPVSREKSFVDFTLIHSENNAVIGDIFEFLYYTQPSLDFVTPSTSPSSGSVVVSVVGTSFFAGNITCKFGSMASGAVGKFISDTLLHCISPPNEPGVVRLDVSFNGGSDVVYGSLKLLYEPTFVIERIHPSKIAIGISNQVVTVIGRNFREHQGLRCRFGLKSYGLGYFQSSTSVACLAPANLQGTAMVSLGRNGQNSEVVGMPVSYFHSISLNISPSAGPVQGGTKIFVSSANISPRVDILAVFDQIEVWCSQASETWICISPAMESMLTRNVSLKILSNGGAYGSQTHDFLYYANPNIASIWPTVGASDSRTTVTLVGSNFMIASAIRCRFAQDLVEAKFVSSSSVECISPMKNNTLSSHVWLSLNDGVDFTMAQDQFTLVEAPSLSSVFPTSGPAAVKGRSITIFGSNFHAVASTECRFGMSRVVPAVVQSSMQAHCELPSKMSGVVLVSIGQYGSIWSKENLPYAVYPDVKIDHLVPSQGPISASTIVTVIGAFTHMTKATFRFGSKYIECPVRSSWEALCSAPVVKINQQITVQLLTNLFESEELPFTYLSDMEVSTLLPSRGNVGMVTIVQVYGSGFIKGCTCRFGDYLSSTKAAKVLSSSMINCVSPHDLEMGKHTVEVAANAMDYTFNGRIFLVERGPVIHEIMPSEMSVGQNGQTLTVIGIHFTDSPALTCFLGLRQRVLAFFVSTTLVTCVVPSKESGTFAVSLSNDGFYKHGGGTKHVTFGYIRSDLQLSPSSGPLSGGTRVQVLGLKTFGSFTCLFSSKSVEGFWLENSAYCTVPAFRVQQTIEVSVLRGAGRTLNHASLRFQYFTEPLIFSLLPQRGPIGGGTVVNVVGTNIPAVVECRFGNVTSPSFGRDMSSSTRVDCIAPAQAHGSVDVEISGNNGGDFTSSGMQFSYEPKLTITSIYPTSIPRGHPGPAITVMGSHFKGDGMMICRFGRDKIIPGVHVSSTLMVCAVPARLVGTVMVDVSNNHVDFSEVSSRLDFFDTLSVVDMSPSKGPNEGGTQVNVRIPGMFSKKVQCMFGPTSVWAIETAYEDDFLCTSPRSKIAQTLELRFWIDGSQLSIPSLKFEYYLPPMVSSVFPSLLMTQTSSIVSVMGVQFSKTGTAVRFGPDVNASKVSFVTSTKILCTAPILLKTSDLIIAVSSNDGFDFTESGKRVVFQVAATIQALRPMRGSPQQDGQLVTVFGTHFAASGACKCQFGSNFSTASTFLTSTAIICAVPFHRPGIVSISIGYDGSNYGNGQLSYTFKWKSFTLITPSKGPQRGGTPVTVSSTDFSQQDKSIVCHFGHKSVEGEVVQPYGAVCLSPRGTPGNMPVLFSVSQDGQVFAGQSASFTYYQEPVIFSFIPSQGFGVGGTVVTLFGSSFGVENLSCRFGLQTVSAGAVNGKSSTMVLCVAPQHLGFQGKVALEISNNGGTDFTDEGNDFLYVQTPILTSIDPSHGITGASNQMVTIIGSNYLQISDLNCKFGINSTGAGILLTSSMLLCKVPARWTAGSLSVQICSQAGCTDSPDVTFTFQGAGVIESILPSKGPQKGGTLISIIINGLDRSYDQIQCQFDGSSSRATMTNFSSLTCITPPMSKAGTYGLKLAVNEAGFSVEGNKKFDFIETYYLDSIEPRSGPLNSRTLVTVIGSGFEESGMCCRFGQALAVRNDAKVLSTTMLLCTSPIQDLPGQVFLEISSSDRDDFRDGSAVYTFELATTVYEIVPAKVLSQRNAQVVQVSGEHFSPTLRLSCMIGNGQQVTATFLSSTRVVCSVPGREAGIVHISVSNNGIQSLENIGKRLEYVSAVKILSITPSTGPLSGSTTVTLRGVHLTAVSEFIKCSFAGRTSPAEKVS